jgi:hypothetical protein
MEEQIRGLEAMSRSTLSLAIAAIATLGTLALVPTGASAMGFGGGGHMIMHGGGGGSGGHSFTGARSFGGGIRIGMQAGAGKGPHIPPILVPHWNHHHWHHWNYGWRVPYYGGVATAAYAAPAYSAPIPERRTDSCTCLTKEYLPDNSVLFKDICTKESALAPVKSALAPLNNDQGQGNPPGAQGYQSAPPQAEAR